HVLRGAADPARDVELRRDLRPRLANLIGVRPPARARHDARAADPRAENRRKVFEDREALLRAHASPAADYDLRFGERDATARRLDVLDDAHGEVLRIEGRDVRLHVDLDGRLAVGHREDVRRTVIRGRAECSSASSSRLPPQRCRVSRTGWPGVAAVTLAASGSPVRAERRAITSLPRSVPAAKTAAAPRSSAARWRMAARASGANVSTAAECTACTGSPNVRARVIACSE